MKAKPRPRKMKLAHMEACFVRLAAQLPDPKTELSFSSPFTLLVAVVLSAQATDVGVNRATKGLFAAADTPQKMVELGIDGITHHIRTIGLFNMKAKNVHRLSQLLIDQHDSVVPEDRAALEALPGGGRCHKDVVRAAAGVGSVARELLLARAVASLLLRCVCSHARIATGVQRSRNLQAIQPSRVMLCTHQCLRNVWQMWIWWVLVLVRA